MAGIFTFDPDPPRVSSPWTTGSGSGSSPTRRPSLNAPEVTPALLSDLGVTKLEAEPQEGPTEYKLHLLLRQRRKFIRTSTATPKPRHHVEGKTPRRQAAGAFPSTQSRQNRLEQLTTQLLWRLQQSCPCYVSSTGRIVIPQLPDDPADLTVPVIPAPLVPGLEESRGALYEIGVADDGTLVGLAKDEMDESLHHLRVMAASLGCKVEVLRMIIVGDCEWWDDTKEDGDSTAPECQQAVKKEDLWVAEAFVSPDLTNRGRPTSSSGSVTPKFPSSKTDQLRVSFTGPTTSGKSTLLGTLSTGTLDNGQGKSRLSLLRHRHEVDSGMTSAVTPELIGYNNGHIINYTDSRITNWSEIHDHAQNGRLVFVVDSAGHPRYRRTVMRGLVGLAPHWTILCLPADQPGKVASMAGGTSSAADILGCAGATVDLAQAHLDLCLNMEVPLAIIITKLDLVPNTANLKQTVGRVLTAIKARDRIPKLIPPSQVKRTELVDTPVEDFAAVDGCLKAAFDIKDMNKIVPIVIISAVRGFGIGQVHALLQRLPIPRAPTALDYTGKPPDPEQPTSLFHIDDTFRVARAPQLSAINCGPDIVISGYMRFGRLTVGDQVVLGPFPSNNTGPSDPDRGLSVSHPSSAELFRVAMRNAVSATTLASEWHDAEIISVRHLRLPVYTLEVGQVGSLGIRWKSDDKATVDDYNVHTRRGMVTMVRSPYMVEQGLLPQAASGLKAIFADPAAARLVNGSLVNIYVAAVRAAATIRHISVKLIAAPHGNDADAAPCGEIGTHHHDQQRIDHENCLVEIYLELLSSREWIELGSKIVLLEGGRKDRSGLEGVVGKVSEVLDGVYP